MKTMILSDLIIMRRNLIQIVTTTFIVVIVIALAMNNTLAPIGACFGTMIPFLYLFTIAGYDEANEWQAFRLTLPASRKDVMVGRYLSILIVTLFAILLGIAVSYLVGFVISMIGTQNGAEFGAAWNYTSPTGAFLSTLVLSVNPPELIIGSTIGGAAVALLLSSITLPLIATTGLTKAARWTPVVAVVLFLICLATFGEGGPLSAYVPDFITWLFSNDAALMYLIIGGGVVSLIAYAISLTVAVKLYEKRGF